MATYQELFDISSDSPLKNKITIAVTIKAHEYITSPTPTSDQLNWSNKALQNPTAEAQKLMPYVLADNKTATVSQIKNASDNAVQTAVDLAVEALIGIL